MPQLMMLARLGEMQSEWKSPQLDRSMNLDCSCWLHFVLCWQCLKQCVPGVITILILNFNQTPGGCNEWKWKIYCFQKIKEGRDFFPILSGPHPSGDQLGTIMYSNHIQISDRSVTISPNQYATELMLCKILPSSLSWDQPKGPRLVAVDHK